MKTMLTRALALLCVVLMMISLFALPVFADDHEGHDHADENLTTEELLEKQEQEEKQQKLIKMIPWISLGGILVVGAAVLLIKRPEKIVKGLRVYKSEFKKVSWLSWKETKKSSLIVLGMLAACALVICLLDLGLYEGIIALINKIAGLF